VQRLPSRGLPDATWNAGIGLIGYFFIKKKLASASCLFSIVIKDYTLGSTNQYYVRETFLMLFSVGNQAFVHQQRGKNQLHAALAGSNQEKAFKQAAADTVLFSDSTNLKRKPAASPHLQFGQTLNPARLTPEYRLKIQAKQIEQLKKQFASEAKKGILRLYTAEDVVGLRPTVREKLTLPTVNANYFRYLMDHRPFVRAGGIMIGDQAVQEKLAGLEAGYVSGWQLAARNAYPDQSLYSRHKMVELVQEINTALQRQDEIHNSEGKNNRYWMMPLVVDMEAGMGGKQTTYLYAQELIKAGAAALHLEDQVSSEKKCGHMGGKVLMSTRAAIENLKAARLAADVLGVPTVLIARTDALGAQLINSDIDPVDQQFLTGERTEEGYYQMKDGKEQCLKRAIARGLAFAPYADMLWFETSKPDMKEAEAFAKAIHAKFPGKKLAYNCSPSFNWKKNLSNQEIAEFQDRLGKMGYKFQFITLLGYHSLNHAAYKDAKAYAERGMSGYVDQIQEPEFESAKTGDYQAVAHQRAAATGFFDKISTIISGGKSSTLAMEGSTEAEQFNPEGGHAESP
jgi:isocitrate lyase